MKNRASDPDDGDEKRARLDCVRRRLGLFPHEDLAPKLADLGPRVEGKGHVRPPIENRTFMPDRY